VCGIVGLKLRDSRADARALAIGALQRLQHRGQDGAGLTVATGSQQLETLRGLGPIPAALHNLATLTPGSAALAHTRYATTGTGCVGELQPFVQGTPRLALAHNGNIVNTAELSRKYGMDLWSASDLEVLLQLYLRHRNQGFVHALQAVVNEANGSYALVGLEDQGSLWGLRDPFGLRPLFFAHNESVAIFASETVAFQGFEGLEIRELSPGEWVRVYPNPEGSLQIEEGILRSERNPRREKKFCMFEQVYFSSPVSEFQGHAVFTTRFRLGEALAQEILTELKRLSAEDVFDYVVPVPDTARSAAIAVAESLKVPYREYLVKNPSVQRTFILPDQAERTAMLKQKWSLVGPELKGKRILLVDDSVVRGNTCLQMAKQLQSVGARQVSLASTCPPIRFGCFYGIDFPDSSELIASGRSRGDIVQALGLHQIYFLTPDSLKRALGSDRLCMACLDSQYPTQDASFDEFLIARRAQRQGDLV